TEARPQPVGAALGGRLAGKTRRLCWIAGGLYHEPRDEINARSTFARLQSFAQLIETRRLAFPFFVENAEGAVDVAAGAIPERVKRGQLCAPGEAPRRAAPRT